MNINKKYKKWTLALVAPALALAPIAVVASCSSSTEEKEAYAITFTSTNQIKATTHKTVKPNQLTEAQFKDEVLNHLNELFAVEGKLPANDFYNTNIVISELDKPDASDTSTKQVSAKVTVNNANTSGTSINKTITLTGLGYEETDLTQLDYSIAFVNGDADSLEIALDNQEENSVETVNPQKLMELVLVEETKNKILNITGNDAAKITDEILENQILTINDPTPNKAEGKVTFKLSVEKPKNGAGNNLEKNITFTGFKREVDPAPEPEQKFVIGFKADTGGKYVLQTVSNQTTNEFGDNNKLKELIIKEKDVIFEATEGTLPTEESWWEDNLSIVGQSGVNPSEGEITATIQLNNSNSSNPTAQPLKKENVCFTGFKPVVAPQETMMNTKLSTVTLGLNGNRVEAKEQITREWILKYKRILFKQGFQLITEVNDIVDGSIITEDINEAKNPIKLKFKVAANKWYDDELAEGTDEKEFEIKIEGISNDEQTGKLLANKLDANKPVDIGLIDPILAEGTFDDFVNNSAEIFDKEFVFEYRKHLLTGDFTKIDEGTKDDFLYEYPADNTGNEKRFVKIVPDQGKKEIQITFTILKEKLVGTPAPTANKEYTIKLNGFKATNN